MPPGWGNTMNEPSCRALLVLPAANTTMAGEIATLCPWLGSLAVARVPADWLGAKPDEQRAAYTRRLSLRRSALPKLLDEAVRART